MARTFFDMRGLRKLQLKPGGGLGGLDRVISAVTSKLPAGATQAGFVQDLLARTLPGGEREPDAAGAPAGASFVRSQFSGASGSRPYRLYVPSHPKPRPALIVMLHGCTQSAEDFAAGTQMNQLAEAEGVLVLYPIQVAGANAQRCWNWFNPADQQREGGEAALIAGMTRSVMAVHGVDPRRVFVAGLSAGGAQAAVLGAAYPDLFSAVGVHSGLACGAARDMQGAFVAMRQGREGHGRHRMRTIIFHGDSDTTVAAVNAEAVAKQVEETAGGGTTRIERGQVPGGLAYTRSLREDAWGRSAVESWTVHGAGHAWSGGSAKGSFTEPRGPDASRAMMIFFLH